MKIYKKYTHKELAESFIFNVKRNPRDEVGLQKELSKARKLVQSELDENDKLYAEVLQKKFYIFESK